jgi:4-hydroxybenzoyl-CoA thioesterase
MSETPGNRRRVRVEFGDCDPAGLVYYPTYLAWFDQGTHHLFESVGLPWRDLFERLGIQAPLVDAQLRCASPASWGDDLDIETRIARWGNSSFVVAHRVANASSGLGVAEGTETRVCVRLDPKAPKRMAPVTIPEEIRKAFGQR